MLGKEVVGSRIYLQLIPEALLDLPLLAQLLLQGKHFRHLHLKCEQDLKFLCHYDTNNSKLSYASHSLNSAVALPHLALPQQREG